jgi:hypothetical protein
MASFCKGSEICWALFMARGAFDTKVQVVLDAKGFRDRRGGDVLMPW